LSPGGASGIFMFAATSKNPPDDVIEKSAIQRPSFFYVIIVQNPLRKLTTLAETQNRQFS
jgi:hypothetical protein